MPGWLINKTNWSKGDGASHVSIIRATDTFSNERLKSSHYCQSLWILLGFDLIAFFLQWEINWPFSMTFSNISLWSLSPSDIINKCNDFLQHPLQLFWFVLFFTLQMCIRSTSYRYNITTLGDSQIYEKCISTFWYNKRIKAYPISKETWRCKIMLNSFTVFGGLTIKQHTTSLSFEKLIHKNALYCITSWTV